MVLYEASATNDSGCRIPELRLYLFGARGPVSARMAGRDAGLCDRRTPHSGCRGHMWPVASAVGTRSGRGGNLPAGVQRRWSAHVDDCRQRRIDRPRGREAERHVRFTVELHPDRGEPAADARAVVQTECARGALCAQADARTSQAHAADTATRAPHTPPHHTAAGPRRRWHARWCQSRRQQHAWQRRRCKNRLRAAAARGARRRHRRV